MRLPRRHGGRGAPPCPPSFIVLNSRMKIGTKGNAICVPPEMYLTLSLRCEIEPPSNAASEKSAGTGHDVERDTKRYRKAVRRHSPRPPPAESPAHFGSTARLRRDHIRLGSLERGLIPVPDTVPRGAAASRFAVASHQLLDLPSPDTSCWFGRGEGNGHTSGGRIPAVASRRTARLATHKGTDRQRQRKGGRCETSLGSEEKQVPSAEATAWSAAEVAT